MYTVDAIVEIPLNTNIKYEYDETSKKIRCDRILNTPMMYPGNYGYIPNTLADDGDPLDILIMTDCLYPGIIIKCKVIGALITEDEKGMDEKIIAVPDKSVSDKYETINTIYDLGEYTLERIKYFFIHYKELDKKKWIKVKDYVDEKKAYQIYENSVLFKESRN